MIGIVVLSHGRLAEELIGAVEGILGDLPATAAVCIGAQEPPAAVRARIDAAVRQVDHGKGVVVLADMIGATPCNMAASLCNGRNEVIGGANLAMLIRLAELRDVASPKQAARLAVAAGRRCVQRARPRTPVTAA